MLNNFCFHVCAQKSLFIGENVGVSKPAWNDPKTSQAKPSQADLAWLVLHVRDYWLGLACKFKKRALAWFWLGLWPGYSVLLYHMTFHPWDQNKTCSKSLKLIVLWNLITVYYFFLSFGYWLGLTCNIILVFQLGLAWLGLFLEIKRLGLAWFGFFWCGFGLAWLGLEYFYHKKTWLGLACSEKSRLADPYPIRWSFWLILLVLSLELKPVRQKIVSGEMCLNFRKILDL